MTHLTAAEFVDLIDGVLPAGRAAHVEGCAACRAQLDEVREAMAAARGAEAHEPSPLFWDHFSARVRAAVAAGPVPVRRWNWLTARRAALPGAAAAAILAAVVLVFLAPSAPAPDAGLAGPTDAGAWLEPSEDGTWDVVVAVSSGLVWEDAEEAGLTMRPGAVDRVVQALSAEERSTLARLLRAELAKPM